MPRVDLNCDVGESFGAWRLGSDEEVMRHVTSVNIACGFHAGDPATMRRTIAVARERGVAVGAHPGLPDLVGFGRRAMELTPEEAYDLVVYQVGALSAFATAAGTRLQHVKPHGALYNMAAARRELAEAVVLAVHAVDPSLVLFGLAKSHLASAARAAGLVVAEEGFADRGYTASGALASRATPGGVIEDPEAAVAQALRLVRERRVRSLDGADVTLHVDTICIHGDAPGAALLAQRLRAALEEAEVTVARPGGGR